MIEEYKLDEDFFQEDEDEEDFEEPTLAEKVIRKLQITYKAPTGEGPDQEEFVGLEDVKLFESSI